MHRNSSGSRNRRSQSYEDSNSKNRSLNDGERSGSGDHKNYDERNSRHGYNVRGTSRGYDQDSTTPKHGMLRRSFSQMLRDKIRPDKSSGDKKNEASSATEGDQKVEERLAEQQKPHPETDPGSATLGDEDPTLQVGSCFLMFYYCFFSFLFSEYHLH